MVEDLSDKQEVGGSIPPPLTLRQILQWLEDLSYKQAVDGSNLSLPTISVFSDQ